MTKQEIEIAEKILGLLNDLEELGIREGTYEEARDEAFAYNGFNSEDYLKAIDCWYED